MPRKQKGIPTESEFMLAKARNSRAGKKVLAKFREAELIGLAWFASVPEFIQSDPNRSRDVLFDQFNLLAGASWEAYIKHPEEALLIVSKIREKQWDATTLTMKMALRENPQRTDAELAERIAEIDGTNPLDVATVKRRRQRLMKAASRRDSRDLYAWLEKLKRPDRS